MHVWSMLISLIALLLFSSTLRLNRYRFRRGEDAIVLLGTLGTFGPLLATFATSPTRITPLDYLLAALTALWAICAIAWFFYEITRLVAARAGN